jgi:threonylcarbamoyladenosine tRNA methylthiotransferase MtaB
MKVSYYSLGCKVNLYESEAIVNQFVDNGFELADFEDVNDVYIINTCSITSVSDAKSRKIIRQAIKRNPEAVVAVMGCYAQLKPEDIKAIEGVDVLVGTNNRHLLYSLVMENLQSKNKAILIEDILKVNEYEEVKIKRYNNKTRGFVKIQDGCNNFCSYCTIPYARGPVRSREVSDVIEEIASLTEQGMKEIILTGINTASYGQDFSDYDFSNLLRDLVNKVENLGRVRISSIEVTEISDKVLEVIKENESKFCMHFHIPLQGGTDKTLKRMNRKYLLDFYREKIKKIRDLFVDVNITTDILAGFCGESDEDFKETCNFIREMGYGELHVFPYSKRPRTVAYKYPDHVNEVTKHLRVNELLKINEELALNYRNKFLGKTVEVLVERVQNNVAFGHTSNYLEVEFSGFVEQNDLVKVMITEVGYPICKGVKI